MANPDFTIIFDYLEQSKEECQREDQTEIDNIITEADTISVLRKVIDEARRRPKQTPYTIA